MLTAMAPAVCCSVVSEKRVLLLVLVRNECVGYTGRLEDILANQGCSSEDAELCKRRASEHVGTAFSPLGGYLSKGILIQLPSIPECKSRVEQQRQ
jgi:hypothetical protein